jgi:hypothetical protein
MKVVWIVFGLAAGLIPTFAHGEPIWKMEEYKPQAPRNSTTFEVGPDLIPVPIRKSVSRFPHRVCTYIKSYELPLQASNINVGVPPNSCVDIDALQITATYACPNGDCTKTPVLYLIGRHGNQTKAFHPHYVAGWWGLLPRVNYTFARWKRGALGTSQVLVIREADKPYRICSDSASAYAIANDFIGSPGKRVAVDAGTCQVVTARKIEIEAPSGATGTFQSLAHDDTSRSHPRGHRKP